MIYGEIIKKERIKRGLSQEELGKILGVTKVSVCGYEKGTRTPTLDIFIRLSDVLELTPNQLLGREIMAVAEGETAYEFPITGQERAMIQMSRTNEKFRLKMQKELDTYKK